MAHELEIVDGVASFFEVSPSGERMAWHKLGACVKNAPTTEEAMRLARQDWTVESKDVFWHADRGYIKGWKANVRSDTGAVLGMVSSKYRIIQNKDSFDFLDSLVQDGVARYETAGCLGIGERTFALLQVKGHTKIADSEQVPYVLVFNSHDGKSALSVCPTSVRVVCANTVRMALSGQQIRFQHNSTAEAKMKMASKMMDTMHDTWSEWVDAAQRMVKCKMDETDLDRLMDELYPAPKDEDTDMAKERHDEKLKSIKGIYKNHHTQQNIKGTAWGVYNAVTYFENHSDQHIVKGQRNEGMAERLTLGTGDAVMSKAFQLLQEAA